MMYTSGEVGMQTVAERERPDGSRAYRRPWAATDARVFIDLAARMAVPVDDAIRQLMRLVAAAGPAPR